jgi:hypothetical protein
MSSASVSTDALGSNTTARKSGQFVPSATSRKEWIKEWCQNNFGKPTPCSAKAVYRLADSTCSGMTKNYVNLPFPGLGLLDLKDRAAQVRYSINEELYTSTD